MLRKGIALLLLLILSSTTASAQEAKLWASKSQVAVDDRIELNLIWSNTGCSEYHVILFRTYPNGTKVRYPAEGLGEALKAPGITPIKMELNAETVGRHSFKYELYCGTSHLFTSNEVQVTVIKGNSSIELRVTPEKLVKGGEVRIEGSVNPSVSGEVSLELVSPSGARRNVSLAFKGNFSHTLTLNEIGTWRFRAHWDGSRDYYGSSSDWVTVEVVEKPLRVKVRTEPPGLPVLIDGKTYESGGEFDWLPGSSHNLTVEREFVQDGKRYLFIGWLGLGNSTSISIEPEESEEYVAQYKVQYYLEVVSSLSESEGSGWYDEGSFAKARVKRSEVEGDFPWIYVFSGWSGDATGRELTSDPIVMNGPKRAVATWEKRLNPVFAILLAAVTISCISIAITLHLASKYRKLKRELRERAGLSVKGKEDERKKRIREKIAKLENMRKRGEIPETVYRKLRKEYLDELKRVSGERKE